LDSGADTYVIGSHDWTILDTDPICTANLVAFDTNKMRKPNCPIITATTKVQTVLGQEILWIVEMRFTTKVAPYLASEYQSCEYDIAINSVSTWHRHHNGMVQGTQCMYLLEDDNTIIPIEIRGALNMYQH